MVNYLSYKENVSGRLNAIFLSWFYGNINRRTRIIKSTILGYKKLFVASGCILYRCRIRICRDSKYIKIGRNSRIESNAFLNAHKGYIEIGERSFIGPNTIIQGYGGVFIGNKVRVAGNVFISSSNHIFENSNPENFLDEEEGKVTRINDNTWIGSNVTIVAGVEIGKYCVIGAGSVVTKNIPDYSLALGSPAKVVKMINLVSSEKAQS
jgi:acetyltransferase-like isoleucine patch superfamily enzyme